VLGALLSEMDGLEEANDLLCIGATNRLDLCDAALVRTGRLGDRIYEIPRPARDATRQILSRYLAPDSQLAATTAAELVDAAASYLHTQHEGAGRIATITLRNGDQREIRSADVLSGALLASAVQRARHTAAHREVEASRVGNGAASAEQAATLGLRLEDLLSALDDALGAEAKKIAQPQFARQVLQIPNGQEIVRVELARERRIPHHRYVRAA
jgi:proteasome-associated ATPase